MEPLPFLFSKLIKHFISSTMDVKRQIQDAVVSFPGLFTALVFLFTIHRFRTWYRLKHIRGPFLWTISDCALLYKTGRGRLPWDLAKLCREYGKSHMILACATLTDNKIHNLRPSSQNCSKLCHLRRSDRSTPHLGSKIFV